MLKLAGSCLLIAAAAGLGNEEARQVKKRLDALYQCKTLVTLLQGQIRYAGSDLEEGFRELGERLEGAFRIFCFSLSERIEDLSGSPFDEIWRGAVIELLADSGLDQEDQHVFAKVGMALGYLDVESQCRHLSNYLEQLGTVIERAETEIRQKMKLYRSLGVCAGLFLTLLLV